MYAGFFWRRASAKGIVAGLFSGIAVTGLLIKYPDMRPMEIHEGLVGLVVNIAVMAAVSLVTRAPDSDHVGEWLRTAHTPTD